MDGTRTARTVALTAALLLGTALLGATLLSLGPRSGLHGDSGATLVGTRTSLVRTTTRHENPAVAPRTTPPPTLQAPAATLSAAPAPAVTVPHT